MVSFQCDGCADTVKKPKLDQHRLKCWATFTCLDCSTTFQNQDYKSHTTCISEAEKYQGALYKGKKAGKQPVSTLVAQPVIVPSQPMTATPSQSAPVSPAPSTSNIHPSRLQQVEGDVPAESSFQGQRGRGGYPPRGRGRGFHGGRGGYARVDASGENRLNPQGGMRSWGSPAVVEGNGEPTSPDASGAANGTTGMNGHLGADHANEVGSGEDGGMKKKTRRGDKGGTGAKANSKRAKSIDGDTPLTNSIPPLPRTSNASSKHHKSNGSLEPKGKNQKRKRLPSPAPPPNPATTGSGKPSEKTLKRLKKNISKLEDKAAAVDAKGGMSLADWVDRVGKAKEGAGIEQEQVLGSVKVGREGDKWVLTL